MSAPEASRFSQQVQALGSGLAAEMRLPAELPSEAAMVHELGQLQQLAARQAGQPLLDELQQQAVNEHLMQWQAWAAQQAAQQQQMPLGDPSVVPMSISYA